MPCLIAPMQAPTGPPLVAVRSRLLLATVLQPSYVDGRLRLSLVFERTTGLVARSGLPRALVSSSSRTGTNRCSAGPTRPIPAPAAASSAPDDPRPGHVKVRGQLPRLRPGPAGAASAPVTASRPTGAARRPGVPLRVPGPPGSAPPPRARRAYGPRRSRSPPERRIPRRRTGPCAAPR